MYTKPHVSTFEGGLNTDVSHHRMAPNMYSDALNIRILTDSGLSSGAIVNEIGNELLFKLPTTVEPVFAYAIGTVTGESGTAEYYLGADPATGTQTTVTGVPDDTAQRAYDYLMADAGVQADIAAGKYVIYFNRKEIVIHNLDNIGGHSVESEPTLGNLVWFNVVGDRLAPELNNSPKIISTGVAGDYIVIFSTAEDNIDPEPDGTDGQIWALKYDKVAGEVEDGYIEIDKTLTLDKALVMHRRLDFSLLNKIHFESYIKSDDIVKIYFYDGYNVLRHLDIASDQTMGIKKSAVDIVADVDFVVPVPEDILETGNLYSAQYRYAYQLYNLDGNQTVYSPTSIGINIYPGKLYSDNDLNSQGGALDEFASKSVRIKIENLDISYERIRVVSIRYPNDTGTPEITVIKDTAIPESGLIYVVDDGNVNLAAVTLEEFRTVGTELFVPQTAEVKDNMLIVGNKIEKRFELSDEVWDARAYRFLAGRTDTAIWSISDIQTTIETAANPDPVNWEIPITHDCIQSYDNQANYKYKTNSTILGGQGPSIEYEFILGPEMVLQNTIVRGQETGGYAAGNTPVEPQEDFSKPKQVRYHAPKDTGTVYDFNGVQYTNNSYRNYASPILAGLFTGYMKNETYRFGVEFYSKKGKKSFVKWIADIRFPGLGSDIDKDWEGNALIGADRYLKNSSAQTTSIPTGEDPDTVTQFDPVTTRPLGIKFTLNSIPVDEDGNPYSYRIVRAERREEDKRIVMQGPIVSVEEEGDEIHYDHMRPLVTNLYSRYVRCHYQSYKDDVNYPGTGYIKFGNFAGLMGRVYTSLENPHVMTLDELKKVFSIISPDFYFRQNYVIPSGLRITPVGLMHTQERDIVDSYRIADVFRDNDNSTFSDHKFYQLATGASQFYWGPDYINNVANNTISFEDSVIANCPTADFNLGSPVYILSRDPGSISFRNVLFTGNWRETGGNEWGELARAGTRMVVTLEDTFDDVSLIVPFSDYLWSVCTLIVNVERTLENQYGGNSYYDRTQTTYIPAGPIMSGSTGDVVIFEGDTYITMFDYLNVNFSERYNKSSGLGLMETHWICQETTVNTAVRSAGSYNTSVDISSPKATSGGTINDWRGNFNIQELGGGQYGIPNLLGGQYVQNFNLPDYNTSYISDNRAPISVPLPLNYDSNIFFKTRIHRSLDKVYDDVYDRWLVFLPDNYKDVNTEYGAITNLIEYANKLYFYQEKAVGIIGINEMALEQTDQAGATLLLGRADVMEQYVYVDNNHGVTIPNSVYSVPQGVIGFDSENLKIFMVGAKGIDELSTRLGVQSFIKNNTEYGAWRFYGAYDSYNNRAYNILYGISYSAAPTVFSPNPVLPPNRQITRKNISFNTALGIFESTYSFRPDNIIVYKGDVMTTNPDNDAVYIHTESVDRGLFYDQAYSWYVTPIINLDAEVNHMLTNFEINMDESSNLGPDKITVETFPNTGSYEQTEFKRRLNTWRCKAPRKDDTEKDRLRGHTFKTQLLGNHTTRVKVHSLLSYSITNIQ